MLKHSLKNTKYLTFFLICVYLRNIYCKPIEVTGKDIKYYKLVPNEGSGSYNFDYGTMDGASRSERGFIKNEPGQKEPLLVVTGSFKHPDGNEVFYIADEQGYRIVTKEEVEDIHNKFSNEILPSSNPVAVSSLPPSPSPFAVTDEARNSKSYTKSENKFKPDLQIPVTESKIIKLNIIKPNHEDYENHAICASGKCLGNRESKIFKIKSLKFG